MSQWEWTGACLSLQQCLQEQLHINVLWESPKKLVVIRSCVSPHRACWDYGWSQSWNEWGCPYHRFQNLIWCAYGQEETSQSRQGDVRMRTKQYLQLLQKLQESLSPTVSQTTWTAEYHVWSRSEIRWGFVRLYSWRVFLLQCSPCLRPTTPSQISASVQKID